MKRKVVLFSLLILNMSSLQTAAHPLSFTDVVDDIQFQKQQVIERIDLYARLNGMIQHYQRTHFADFTDPEEKDQALTQIEQLKTVMPRVFGILSLTPRFLTIQPKSEDDLTALRFTAQRMIDDATDTTQLPE
jgi:ABC-type uncharacterized transport system substrate-binding protein